MSDQPNIVFMGTPDFAVASLEKLVTENYSVIGVITAPDKPAGRGKKILTSPVKQYALEAGIPNIMQPSNLKDPGFLDGLKSLKADIQVVVAFRMLPEAVWSMPPLGTINLHASLLPDYRGAAPINHAIINGETETGVTTFFIEKEIDTGKIIFQEKVTITPEMNAGDLHDELMIAGADLLNRTLKAIQAGNYPAVPQNTLMKNKVFKPAPKIFKDDCRIDWNQPVEKIHNFIRGLSPYPAAFTTITDRTNTWSLKIFRTQYESRDNNGNDPSIHSDGKTFLNIELPNGILHILELQMEGRKRMNIDEFLRGFQDIGQFMLC